MQTILNSLHASLHSLHEKVSAIQEAQLHFYRYVKEEFFRMSKTQADVQAALDDLSATTSTAFSDIAALVSNLEAQIAALQGQASPDLSSLTDTIAAIKAKVVAADPGAPAAAPAAPSA